MNLPIGQKIKEVLRKSGITQVYFADQIGMSRRNLERFFERDDISINQLIKASEILNYDFVEDFLNNSKYQKKGSTSLNISNDSRKSINEISIQLHIKGEISLISKNFPELLNILKKEAERRGLSIV